MTKVSSQELHDQLKRIFGFNHFKGNQEIALKVIEAKYSF